MKTMSSVSNSVYDEVLIAPNVHDRTYQSKKQNQP